MAKFLKQCKEVGKDMVRVIKDDPAGTVLDVAMTLMVGAYLFLNKMSGYYTGKVHASHDIIDAVKEWYDENSQPLDEEKGEQSDEA